MSLEPTFMPSPSAKQQRPHITVRPESPQQGEAQPRFEPRKPFQKATLGDTNNAPSVDDMVDLINPLQHIPVVGHIYRALTGDTVSKEVSVLGGALYGGAIGLAAASISAFAAQEVAAAPTAKTLASKNDSAAQPLQTAQIEQSVKRPLITAPASQPPAPPIAAPEAKNDPLLSVPPRQAIAPKPTAPMPLSPPTPLPSVLPVRESEAPALPLSVQEQHKHDAILELFGSGVSSLQSEYRKAQQLGHLQAAQSRIIV